MSSKMQKSTNRREDLLQDLYGIEPFRRGSLNKVYQKCGKSNCICADANHPGHGPYYLLTRKENGKTKTKKIRGEEEIKQVKRQIANYKVFQGKVNELIQVNEAICEEKKASGDCQHLIVRGRRKKK